MCVLSVEENQSVKNVRRLLATINNHTCEIFFHRNMDDDEFADMFLLLAKKFDAVVVCERI